MEKVNFESLTPKQRQCLRMVFEHLSPKEIASRLNISEHTVKQHIAEARRRLGSPTRRAAAIALAAYEASLQSGDPPFRGVPAHPVSFNWGGSEAPGQHDVVREERATFDVDLSAPTHEAVEQGVDERRHPIRWIVLMVLAIMAIIVLAPSMVGGIQDIANMIEPPSSSL